MRVNLVAQLAREVLALVKACQQTGEFGAQAQLLAQLRQEESIVLAKATPG